MKKAVISATILSSIFMTGCIGTQFQKSVSVTKDADGRIIQTVETETVIQGGSSYPMKLKHLNKQNP